MEAAVTAVNTGEPITPTIGLVAVPPVYAFAPGATKVLGPKSPLRSLLPEKMVVAEMFVPLTDEAVTAVNTGEPITPTIGLDGVPPVYAFTPGATYVGAPINELRSLEPEKKVVAETLVPETDEAVTAVNTGEPTTLTTGLEGVPPVTMLTPG